MDDKALRVAAIMQVMDEKRIRWRENRPGIVEETVTPGTPYSAHQWDVYPLRLNDISVYRQVKALGPELSCKLGIQGVTVEDGNESAVVHVRVPVSGDVEAKPFWTMMQAAAADAPLALLLGEDPAGRSLWLDMARPDNAHLLVSGMTGSGKTSLLRAVAYCALLRGWEVVLLDVTAGLAPLSGQCGVWRGGIFDTGAAILYALEAQARALHSPRSAQRLVVFDEVSQAIAEEPAIAEPLASLARTGRSAGIHLALGTQHPLAGEIGRTVLANIGVRLCGRVSDPTAAYSAAGQSASELVTLRGSGDMILYRGGDSTRFQATHLPDPMVAALAASRGTMQGRTMLATETPEREKTGRPRDPIPDWMLQAILAHNDEHGWPTQRWIQLLAKEKTGKLWGAGKAGRALKAAKERAGCEDG